jgi:hypothetical protein
MYMFKSLRDQMGGGKDRDFIDKEHVLISYLIQRQSECDYLLMERNVSFQNKREICSDYWVLHIQEMEVVLLRDL